MSEYERIEADVKRALNYLIAEGLVVEENGMYRMKTPEEQAAELEKILGDDIDD